MAKSDDDRFLRFEDRRFVTGTGRFTTDLHRDNMAFAVCVRAQVARGRLLSVEAADAAAAPGVLAVFSVKDLDADNISDQATEFDPPREDGGRGYRTLRSALVRERINHIGEPVAFVVAETAHAAMGAAELMGVDVAEEPVAISGKAALAEDAPRVWPETSDNIAFVRRFGDEPAVQSAFADAAHVTRASLEISRVTACTMEPRAALGECGADGRLTLTTGTQNPFDLRRRLATVFGVEPEAVRVVAPDVGGSFGMKGELYREDVLVLYAARRLGRPVLWISSRTEAFLSDAQGREGCVEAELALNDRHEFTALRTRIDVDVGAYLSRRSLGMQNNIGGLAGAYRTPAIFAELRGVHTNTTPISPYRGNGRPEATYILERLIDQAARELAVDPFMLRKQNLVTPDQMPFRTGLVFRYDCGNFPATMDRAAELAELDGIAARREDAMKRGMLRGVGISNPIESASSPARNDIATIVAAPDGGIEVRTGAVSTGQGMETVLPRIVGDALGVDPSRIRYLQADSDVLANGRGAGGSGGLGISGSAVSKAVDALVEKARALAADALEAAVEDIEHTAGTFAVAGTDRTISLAEVARRADHRNGLSVAGEFLPPAATFPNGCHIAEVEIDPDTGAVRVVRYVSVEDVGNVVNQVIVDGQLMGGIVQGMGQALGEEIHYDADSGQLLTGSFQDYPMPRAQDIPEFKFDSLPVPTAINPFGAKGVGEAGTVGALSAVMNAVNDALASAGAEPIDMPSTPARVWKALARATGRAGQSPD